MAHLKDALLRGTELAHAKSEERRGLQKIIASFLRAYVPGECRSQFYIPGGYLLQCYVPAECLLQCYVLG